MRGQKRIREITEKLINVVEILPIKKKYYCNICGKKSITMLPKGEKGNRFEKLKIIGGGRRKKAYCPKCDSFDRERYVYYILKMYTNILTNDKTEVLHIAPEKNIKNKIEKEYKNCEYYTGDINQGENKYKVDIRDIQFEDNKFDYIICNHVLEHVIEEEKALKEFMRVIKPTGKIILSVPISLKNENTLEYDENLNEKERDEIYGQKDHVRLYGKDLKNRLMNYGYKVHECIAKQEIQEEEIKKISIIPEDRIYICEK